VKSAPDGYTLMIISSTPLVTLRTFKRCLRRVEGSGRRDAEHAPHVAFVVNPATGIGSIQDLIARAKKQPGRLNYASAGNGSGQHLYVELLKHAADINLTHVPYKGAAPALQAVLAGEPGMMLDVHRGGDAAREGWKAARAPRHGQCTARAAAGCGPFDSLFPGLGIPGWHGIFATGGTPKPILDKLAVDIRAVLALPAVTSRFRELGVEPSGVSGEEFNAIVRARLRALGRNHPREQSARGLTAPLPRPRQRAGDGDAVALDLDVAALGEVVEDLADHFAGSAARAAISCGFGRFSTTRTPSRSTARSRSMRATRP